MRRAASLHEGAPVARNGMRLTSYCVLAGEDYVQAERYDERRKALDDELERWMAAASGEPAARCSPQHAQRLMASVRAYAIGTPSHAPAMRRWRDARDERQL